MSQAPGAPRRLGDLLAHLESRRAAKPVAVFDLDDTLLSTSRRHLRILREYADRPEVRLKRADEALKLAAVGEERLRYSVVDTAREAGLSDREALEDLRSFWFQRFFRNEYLVADHPVPGAADYCRDVLRRGTKVVYFTGRDETMRGGTLATLERWGFPMPDERVVVLVLKPRFDMPDLEYKREGLRKIASLGPVEASFENEPAHINLFQEAFPDSWLFLLETKHSGKPVEPHPSSMRIRDFRR